MVQVWYTEQQLDWMEAQLPRFQDSQTVTKNPGSMLVTLSGEFFALWENPQVEAEGTYRQPKRMRKDKPAKPRQMYGTSKEEYQEWVVTRKEVR